MYRLVVNYSIAREYQEDVIREFLRKTVESALPFEAKSLMSEGIPLIKSWIDAPDDAIVRIYKIACVDINHFSEFRNSLGNDTIETVIDRIIAIEMANIGEVGSITADEIEVVCAVADKKKGDSLRFS